ncbi:peptidase S8, partial [Candidatus Bathyarchaeota archaeon]|nr:peptidase S8 [Candidatus Bathyarchaeota archaeon]
ASYIEPNMKVQALFSPNDPLWNMQWGPRKIEADWAWNITLGSQDVLVAVIDTGIYYYHEDLTANYVALGYDWVNMDNDPIDDHGHGTHCAGIIAATINNSKGIAGISQVRIMAEKVLDSWGYGYVDWVANGIIHATDAGARIISMSLGGYGYSALLHEAVKYAYDHRVLLIAAAGNDNTNIMVYPAGYEEVVAVAATDQNDYKAWFSNWGDWIELAAPGVSVYSTVPWGYVSWSGTSMACPHVSGVAALVWSLHHEKTRDWLRLWLRYTADDLGASGFDVNYGYGRINARKAVEQPPPAHELIAYELSAPRTLNQENQLQ